MLNLKNHVTLVGNMGMNARITEFENGKKIARFSLATDKGNKTGDSTNKTEWHQVFAWGNLAQFIEKYGEKGGEEELYGDMKDWFNPDEQDP